MRATDFFHGSSRLTARDVVSALLLAFTTTCVLAQADDPPLRVGRLSEFQGPVFIAPDDPNAEWQPLGLNHPITMGDNVWSGQDARVEIDFGAGHVRLSRETNIHFSQLDDRQFSAYLASGRAILRLRALEPGETAKFDTANAQIDILRPGDYRIETDADGLGSTVIVREGEVQLRTSDASMAVLSGQIATITGNGPGSAVVVREGVGTDGFDAWSGDRDRRFEGGSQSAQYISSYVPGVRDLDQYGAWDNTPTYGAVWYPTAVAADWVPYRDGSWTYVRSWGWTWVDNAPWGWAPFHYGRWVRIGPRWAWCPGEFVRRPVWAPALVAWYGGPSGTSWSAGFAGRPTFGWVPLSWGEPYWPHHRYSNDYWRMVNRPYAVNVGRVPSKPLQISYANARIPGAVTAVSGEVFTGKRPVGNNHVAVPVAALAGAAVTTTALAVRPTPRLQAIDSRPRGAPAPASTFIGRGPLERPEMRAPADGRAYTGRPGIITEPSPSARQPYTPSIGGGRAGTTEAAPGGRQAYTPSVDSGRPMSTEPAPGFARPGAGSPPPYARQPMPEGRSMRPTPREPAPVITAPPSAPLSSPGQVSAPALRQAPPARANVPEPAPMLQRPIIREAPPTIAPQYVPATPQVQRGAPSQYHAPSPPPQPAPAIQSAPAPAPVPSQAQGRPHPPAQQGPAQPGQVPQQGLVPGPMSR